MQKMRDNLKGVFASRSTLLLDVHKMIEILNPKIVGMRNYYALKNAGKQLNKMDWYIIKKFTLWHNYKTQNKRRYARISKVRKIIYNNGLQRLAV
ncbi:group II intron maturase-specific domain-containing protein [Petroclostridium sp. X23]